jgi:MurNAc alpha-1-phosphate uridylyltransferase
MPRKAMVLAAGLGLRMRPLTETTPKPLIPVGGKPLIDWGLDALKRRDVEVAVVNVHHLADQMITHLARRARPHVVVSDERDALLDSGGGIMKALPILGEEPFFILNADTFWIDRSEDNLGRLALAWDADRMDILILLADPKFATGHTGKLDFVMQEDGRLMRAGGSETGFIYAGAAILHPRHGNGRWKARERLAVHSLGNAPVGLLFDLLGRDVHRPKVRRPARSAVRSAPVNVSQPPLLVRALRLDNTDRYRCDCVAELVAG